MLNLGPVLRVQNKIISNIHSVSTTERSSLHIKHNHFNCNSSQTAKTFNIYNCSIMMDIFKEKTVIITGASRGIGAEIAVHFAKQEANVVLTARSRDDLEKTVTRCKEEAGTKAEQILVVEGDITKQEDVKHVIDTSIERFKSIHVLVNNAGASTNRTPQSATVEDVESMFQINTKGAFMMCKEALPHLIKQKGNIVNISSIAGLRPFPHLFASSMAKAALDQMTKCMAIDFASKGVRVNSVNPGTIPTEMTFRSGIARTQDEYDDYIKRSALCHPLQRVGDVQEVAQAVLWLASDLASFTTGAILPVDGGRYATAWYPAPAKKV